MLSKKALAIKLSKFKLFEEPDPNLEQYPTDPEVGGDVLHNAYMLGDIQGKHVLDLACGPGILGIGAVMMGAEKATMLDIDNKALRIAQNNAERENAAERITWLHKPVTSVIADVVIMNPPFGSKDKHLDKIFLDAAMESAKIIYSIHDAHSKEWLKQYPESKGFEVTHIWEYDFALKKTMRHHKKRLQRIPVITVRLQQVL